VNSFDRVVLVGLPGAGKSTVGRMVAKSLQWEFVDLDAEIERRAGRSVADLFEADGESAFRALERELTLELCSGSRLVLAPGGGWAAQPGMLEQLPADSALIWLQVSPAEAIRRLRGSPAERPLLAGPDPLGALAALAEERTEYYAQADLIVPVDGCSAAAAAEIIIAWLERST
jgi:shikimate kinase